MRLQQRETLTLDCLTFSEKMLHLLTCLVIVDEDIKTKALEALAQLAGVSIRTVAYVHPCLKHTNHLIRRGVFTRMTSKPNQIGRLSSTCLLVEVFVVDDDTLSHSLVAHPILECW